MTKAVDPLGREISFVYDTNDVDLIEARQTRASQNELLYSGTYNEQHLPLTKTDTSRQTTTFTYNSRGQVLTIANPRNETTSYTYDTNGYLVVIDGPLPGTNDASHFSYDAVGRLRTAGDQDGYTLTFDYDNLDRITKITFPDGTFDQIVYNRLDPEVIRDRAGREIKLTHDALGQLTSVQDALGRVTRYQWCGCGGLDALIDPLGRTTSWVRDLQGRVMSKVYPDGSQVRYEYDTATGWLKSIRDEQNQVTMFDRNLDGTLRQKRFLNSLISTPAVAFTYDPNYRRALTMTDGIGQTSFGYYPVTGAASLGAGQLASVDGPLPNDTITFEYDELGRESARSINSMRVARTWDAKGRLIQMTNSLGTFTYSWDGASTRLSSLQFPNGQHSTFSYFPNLKDQLLQQISHFKPDSSLLSRFTYDYNVLQQVIQATRETAGPARLNGRMDMTWLTG